MRRWCQAGMMAGLSVVLGCTHASSPAASSLLDLGKAGRPASSRAADGTGKAKDADDLSLAGMPPSPPGVIKVTPDMLPPAKSQWTKAPQPQPQSQAQAQPQPAPAPQP